MSDRLTVLDMAREARISAEGIRDAIRRKRLLTVGRKGPRSRYEATREQFEDWLIRTNRTKGRYTRGQFVRFMGAFAKVLHYSPSRGYLLEQAPGGEAIYALEDQIDGPA